MSAAEFDLSGLGLLLRGLPEPARAALEGLWAPFRTRGLGAPFLDVLVEILTEPPGLRPPAAEPTPARHGEGSFRFEVEEGSIEVGPEGLGRSRLSASAPDRQAWALVNLLLAACGFRLLSLRGGALHAAAAVLDGRAFLAVGPRGSGKTTWAKLARAGGARVLGDEVVLVVPEGGTLLALGSPFRAELATEPGPGRYPVAAILFPEKEPTVRIDRVGRAAIEGRLLANLLYGARAFGRDPRVGAAVEGIASLAPAYRFGFPAGGSIVEQLRTL